MRRDFAIMLALLIAAVGVVPWAHGTVNEAKDQVEIRETILYGDSFWAEGLEVGFNSKFKDQIFWDTTFWPGTDKKAETKFSYYHPMMENTPDDQAEQKVVTVKLHIPSDEFQMYDTSFAYIQELEGTNEKDGNYYYNLMYRPVVDLRDRMEEKETRTEVVSLSQYYDYYPMALTFDVPMRYIKTQGSIFDTLDDIFRIPIPEDHKMRVTVERGWSGGKKDSAEGERVSKGSSPIYRLEYNYVLTEDSFYFLICNQVDGEKTLDFSQFRDGYGIYRVPLEQTGTMTWLPLEQLELCYSIDETAVTVYSFQWNEEREELLLLTEEAGSMWLTIIDERTLDTIQKIELVSWVYPLDLFYYPDFLAIKTIEQQILIVAAEEDGWKLQCVIPTDELSMSISTIEGTELAWDGKRLAIATGAWGNLPREMEVAICTEDGLLFYADYGTKEEEATLNTEGNNYTRWQRYDPGVEMQSAVPITVTWENETKGKGILCVRD